MQRSQPPKSSLSKLESRLIAGNQVAEILESITSDAPVATVHTLRALAARIRQCNHPANSWIAPNIQTNSSRDRDHSGTTPSRDHYDAIGRLWRCGSKLCPDCLARQSRINRKRLREALNAQKAAKGERFSFATFTIPNVGTSLTTARELVDRSWTLFRKRKLCVSLIRGWSKSEEFTVTPNGFHYHLHCIFLHQWFLYQELRRVWTDCVQIAFEERNIPFTCPTSDGLLYVVLDQIGKPCMRHGGRVFTMEQTIQEGAKYLTKSDSWSKLRPNDLIEIAMIRKWNRMFELGGSFRSLTTSDAEADEPIVHTRPFSDGGSPAGPSHWRDRVNTMSIAEYTDILTDEFHRCVNGRLRQLELRYHGSRVYTYAEILARNRDP